MGSNVGSLALPVAGLAIGAATGGLGFGLTGFSLFQAAAAGASIASLVGTAAGVGVPKAPSAISPATPAVVAPPAAANAPTPADSAVLNAGSGAGGSRAGAAASSMGGTVGASGPQGLVSGQTTEKSSLLGG